MTSNAIHVATSVYSCLSEPAFANVTFQHSDYGHIALQDALAIGCFAFCASGELTGTGSMLVTSEAVLVSSIHGSMDVQQYLTMHELSRQGCQRIAEFTRLSLDKVFS